ncbi:shikimate kinase [Paenalcaligenes niemegkensis]|uniref:shikimate kinase n=1 Tax=Paenalcaligenes niemegkensis TaxID=2895469 RepID=UPI0027E26BD2|nr:shikimate kinase [Paenalcaligenes niemegkensis]
MTDSLPLDLMQVESLAPISEDTLRLLAQPGLQSVFLVGMMGAGKTTIGRQLAKVLDRQFVDLDHELEARCGVRVSVIFDIEGEQGFRKRETSALDACSRQTSIVLATGGGAVISAENRAYLKQRGVVVYLRASAEELFRRVSRDKNRPLLQTSNPRQRLGELLAEREPLYQEVADIVLETGSAPISTAVRNLLALLKEKKVA